MENGPMEKLSHEWDAWRMFRIMAEFAQGFQTMASIGPSVSIFGASQTRGDDPYYNQAAILASKITEKGFAVITGGGPGIMEAANQGAQTARGKSCGLCIDIPAEEEPNPFIDRKYLLHFHYFFVRKVMFIRYAQSFVVFPGGFGTLDELFEALTLIKTKKIKPFPIYLVGVKYWKGLLDWLKAVPMAHGSINADDLKLCILTDDLDEIACGIEAHFKKTKCLENF
jgi:hypothetical protein